MASGGSIRANSRLTQLGLFAGAGLLFLGSVFGYFRLDNATRGYYTGSLAVHDRGSDTGGRRRAACSPPAGFTWL